MGRLTNIEEPFAVGIFDREMIDLHGIAFSASALSIS
jgi:hypothetical protein